jgi:hypothetical protein
MTTIWKFPVNPGRFNLSLPKFAVVLSVQTQKGQPMMWVLCNDHPDATKEERDFVALGTGHDAEIVRQNMRFIGTFQLDDGDLIFHLFESMAKKEPLR